LNRDRHEESERRRERKKRRRGRKRRSNTSRSNSSFKLHAVFPETIRRKEFIGMSTDGVEVTVAADDRERKGGKERRRKREEEKEKGWGVVLQRVPVAFQTGLTPCPSGSLVGVLSRWQSRHRATSPFSHPFHLFFPLPHFFHTLYATFLFPCHNCIVLVIKCNFSLERKYFS